MIGFAISAILLFINGFFVFTYVGTTIVYHIISFFMPHDDETFWTDEESEMIREFKSWIHSWDFLIVFLFMLLLVYYHANLVLMNVEDETLHYV